MKNFVYFDNKDGGMGCHEGSDIKEFSIYGWMNPDVKLEDLELIKWSEKAEVGEMMHHRLGVLVRLKDL